MFGYKALFVAFRLSGRLDDLGSARLGCWLCSYVPIII